MIIRRGQEPDILKVSRLWLQMVGELDPGLTPNADLWREHARQFLKSGNYFQYVAEDGGRFCGFIDCFVFDEPATGKRHLVGQHFFVLPEFRKTMLAGKLWRAAIAEGKCLGAQTLELFCFEKEVPYWEEHGFSTRRILMRRE